MKTILTALTCLLLFLPIAKANTDTYHSSQQFAEFQDLTSTNATNAVLRGDFYVTSDTSTQSLLNCLLTKIFDRAGNIYATALKFTSDNTVITSTHAFDYSWLNPSNFVSVLGGVMTGGLQTSYITSIGSVTANAFYGDGSHLTGILSGSSVYPATSTVSFPYGGLASTWTVTGQSNLNATTMGSGSEVNYADNDIAVFDIFNINYMGPYRAGIGFGENNYREALIAYSISDHALHFYANTSGYVNDSTNSRYINGYFYTPQMSLLAAATTQFQADLANTAGDLLLVQQSTYTMAAISISTSQVVNYGQGLGGGGDMVQSVIGVAIAQSTASIQTQINNISTSNLIPVGMIMTYISTNAPSGYLYCNGQAVSTTTYSTLYAIIGFTYGNPGSGNMNLPDMRGMFLRGLDNGKGRDPDGSFRVVGSTQSDSFQGHYHGIIDTNIGSGTFLGQANIAQPGTGVGGVNGGNTLRAFDAMTDGVHGTPRTASETRPSNIAVSYIIKY